MHVLDGMYLQFQGVSVPGEALDPGHVEWINVSWFRFADVSEVGVAIERAVSANTFHFGTSDQIVLAPLSLLIINGRHAPKVVLERVLKKLVVLRLEMTDVVVTALEPEGKAHEARLLFRNLWVPKGLAKSTAGSPPSPATRKP